MPVEDAQEFTVEIAASPSDCFDAIIDFESYPRWSSTVRRADVLEYDDAGIGRLVEFRIDIPLKSIRYVLEYSHKRPNTLCWRSVDGDVESIEGSYRFRKCGPNRAEVTCRQAVRIGFWLPGPLRRLAERSALQDSVLEFKKEVERRAEAKPRRIRAN